MNSGTTGGFIKRIRGNNDKDTWRDSMKTIARIGLAVVGMCVLAVAAVASDVTIPNVFTSGTTASAAAVNLNFTAVETAIDDNDARLDAIQAGGVTSAYITDSTITTNDIAADTITAADIAADTITAADIAAGAVGTSEIADSTITTNDIAADTITAADIATGAVTTTEILDGTITSADIAAEVGIPRNATGEFSGVSVPVGTTYGTMGSVAINAPAAGYVLVLTSGDIQLSSKAVGAYSSVIVGVSNNTTSPAASNYIRFYLSADPLSGSFNIPFTAHGIFSVSAGSNTFYTLARNDGQTSSGSAGLWYGRITAIFIRY